MGLQDETDQAGGSDGLRDEPQRRRCIGEVGASALQVRPALRYTGGPHG